MIKNNENCVPYDTCIPGCRFISYCIKEKCRCNYSKNHVKTVAIDVDNTIFTNDQWGGPNEFGKMNKNADKIIRTIRDELGFKIAIWTVRSQIDSISKVLHKHNIVYDFINENPNQPPDASNKISADYYVDDKGITYISWEQVLNEIIERERKN